MLVHFCQARVKCKDNCFHSGTSWSVSSTCLEKRPHFTVIGACRNGTLGGPVAPIPPNMFPVRRQAPDQLYFSSVFASLALKAGGTFWYQIVPLNLAGEA